MTISPLDKLRLYRWMLDMEMFEIVYINEYTLMGLS